MSATARFDDLTLRKLRRRLARARRPPSPAAMRSAPLTRLEDLASCPVTTRANTLDLPCPPRAAALFNSGATGGAPTYVFMTPSDLCTKGDIAVECLTADLCDPAPRRFLLVNLMDGGGGWSGTLVSALGTHPKCITYSPINVGAAETIRLCEMAMDRLADRIDRAILLGTPPALIRLSTEISRTGRRGHWPVTRIGFGGDGMIASQLARVKEAFPAASIVSILSSTEAGAYGVSGCGAFPVHSVIPFSCFFWIRDEGTGDPIHEPNRPGEVIATNLYSDSLPINFRTNDRAEWIVPDSTFRARGRRRDLISFSDAGCIRVEARVLADAVLRESGALVCQIHLHDEPLGGQLLEVRVDGARRILAEPELRELVSRVTPDTNPRSIRAHLTIRMSSSPLTRSRSGKTPLFVDHRES